MGNKKTDMQFTKEVYDLVGDEYEFLDPYAGTDVKIRVKHNTCGRIYEVVPHSFVTCGRRCAKCRKLSQTKTEDQFKKEIQDLVGTEYVFLESYKQDKTKILCKHSRCGHEYLVNPRSFLNGSRCPKCGKEANRLKQTKTHEEFVSEIHALVGNEYTILEDYTNTNTKIMIRHNTCGREYSVRPDSFIRGARCKPCRSKQMSIDNTKTTDQFSREVENLTNGDYELVGNYANVKTKVSIKHNTCGFEYEVYPFLFQRGRRCPRCNKSKGEKLVEYVLQNMGIEYETQVTFEDLKRINNLSYDFYLPKYDILIEYQGIQHYQPVEIFGGEPQFLVQQHSDSIKKEYALENGYDLVEVPYTADTYLTVQKCLLSILK